MVCYNFEPNQVKELIQLVENGKGQCEDNWNRAKLQLKRTPKDTPEYVDLQGYIAVQERRMTFFTTILQELQRYPLA
jgi:uncharacterized protein involved in exopolysaccharide biosynthesis